MTRESTESLIDACITSRLDYGKSLLYGLPKWLIQKLQRVQKACALLIYNAPRHCHITPLLHELHWLSVSQRILFKILLPCFKVINGKAANYIIDLLSIMPPSHYNLSQNKNGVILSHPFVSKFNGRVSMGPVGLF